MPTSTSDLNHPGPLTPARDIKAAITERARMEGFAAVGFADPADPGIQKSAAHFRQFLDQGQHGDMAWLSEPVRLERRLAPLTLWPETKSIIMLAMTYGPDRDPMAGLAEKDRGLISCYAQGRDYHDVVKKALKRLGRWLAEEYRGQLKVFVDTAPVMEKPLAALAGLGWQGKHSNLVSRDLGSWFFLGAIYTDLPLAPDAPHDDHCGSCQACMDICPTAAITASGRIDARRCISYLTIEHLGHIERQYRKAMGNRIYGCDDCLAVCPWNKFAEPATETRLTARAELIAPALAELAALDDTAFRKLFTASAIKRLGRDRFVRNVLIAIGNSANPSLVQCAESRLNDPSPLVRAMAIWALSQLLDPAGFANLHRQYSKVETDPAVTEEWDMGAAEIQ